MGAETSKGFRAPFLSTAFDYIPYHYLGDIVEDSLFLSENAQLSARIIENNIKFSGLDKKYSTFRIYPRGPPPFLKTCLPIFQKRRKQKCNSAMMELVQKI